MRNTRILCEVTEFLFDIVGYRMFNKIVGKYFDRLIEKILMILECILFLVNRNLQGKILYTHLYM